jgi:hypothetical protein
MISTLFGDLEYGNQQQMSQWLYAHSQEHKLIVKTATKAGHFLNHCPLETVPDIDWLGRHGISHLGFQRLYIPDSSEPPITLLTPLWENAADFENWHQGHNLIHQVIRPQLGIYG